MAYQTYRPSKTVPIAGLLLFIIGGLLGCFLIEASYVYLMRILGNLFLRVLVIALSLTLHGLWLLWLSRACRIRHPKLVRIISIIILAATLYFGRCVYVNLVQEIWEKGMAEMWSQGVAVGRLAFTWVRLFFRPDKVFAALVRILPYGVASINGVMINSIPLLLLWIVEWALKILIPYYIIAYFISRPYDETKKVCWKRRKSGTFRMWSAIVRSVRICAREIPRSCSTRWGIWRRTSYADRNLTRSLRSINIARTSDRTFRSAMSRPFNPDRASWITARSRSAVCWI